MAFCLSQPILDYWFPAETIRQLNVAGFTLVERFGNLWCYTLNFRKAERQLESTRRGRRWSKPAKRSL